MGFQTAFRPRPVFNERPPVPVVPIERVRPSSTSELAQQLNLAHRIKIRVAMDHGVTLDDIEGIDRCPEIDAARRAAYRAIREALPEWTVSQIARAMGKTFNAAASALKGVR